MTAKPSRLGMFIDPPATLLRKPTAAATLLPSECVAIALTAAEWRPGKIMDPDGDVVRLVLHSLKREGWKIVAMERADYDHGK